MMAKYRSGFSSNTFLDRRTPIFIEMIRQLIQELGCNAIAGGDWFAARVSALARLEGNQRGQIAHAQISVTDWKSIKVAPFAKGGTFQSESEMGSCILRRTQRLQLCTI